MGMIPSSAWYRSLSLSERASLQKHNLNDIDVNFKTNFTNNRVERWRSEFPLSGLSYFHQRLSADGLTETQFSQILSESTEELSQRISETPDWIVRLSKIFSRPAIPEKITIPKIVSSDEFAGFINVLEPLITEAIYRFREGIDSIRVKNIESPFDIESIVEIFLSHLYTWLLTVSRRTLVLEMRVAGLRGQLNGNTPHERFESFIRHLYSPNILISFLEEYPVLARQLLDCVDRWLNFSLGFLERLCQDWQVIQLTFGMEKSDSLTQIDMNASDKHQGGQTVLLLHFQSGSRLVYKPRPLAVALHFQQLLNWINSHNNELQFRVLTILDRVIYGWVEFVVAQDCKSPEEITWFYKRQGGYLALLYVLAATDIFAENVMAVGEQPILFDLETLFHPDLDDTPHHDANIYNVIRTSVLKTLLLPIQIRSDSEQQSVEVSGLAAKPGQETPWVVPKWKNVGTDQMQLIHEHDFWADNPNRPVLEGKVVDPLTHSDAIVDGFTKIYRLLLIYRDELLSEKVDSPISRFAQDEVRIVLRPTRNYTTLLEEGYHPSLLRDALDRDRYWDHLWAEIVRTPSVTRAIPAERYDLQHGDIPLFLARPESRDLWTSTGECIPEFFRESPMETVRHRIMNLCEDNLIRQRWFIRASFATLDMETSGTPNKISVDSMPEETGANREQLIDAAQIIGNYLENCAFYGENDVNWLGLQAEDNHNSIEPCGINLYNGLPGIALFLAYLGTITTENHYTELAQKTLVTAQKRIETEKSAYKHIGAFQGWGGIIYTLTHLGMVWNRPELLKEAESLVALVNSLIEQDESLDVVGGAAGCIKCLLNLYSFLPSEHILATAVRCGEHLLRNSEPMVLGIGWKSKKHLPQPLTGFSHGAAGFSWALLQLAAVTKDKRFHSAALVSLEYERYCFSPTEGNWLSYRLVPIGKSIANTSSGDFRVSWCHGAPGIGLSRLALRSFLNDEKIDDEIAIAIQTTLHKGFGMNHSLCHGDLGNLELLLQANQKDNGHWQGYINHYTRTIVAEIKQQQWQCGTPFAVETPGLMVGLAGIGLQLLRLADASQIPSVLMLEPPIH